MKNVKREVVERCISLNTAEMNYLQAILRAQREKLSGELWPCREFLDRISTKIERAQRPRR